jgi:hypothetical protein
MGLLTSRVLRENVVRKPVVSFRKLSSSRQASPRSKLRSRQDGANVKTQYVAPPSGIHLRESSIPEHLIELLSWPSRRMLYEQLYQM